MMLKMLMGLGLFVIAICFIDVTGRTIASIYKCDCECQSVKPNFSLPAN
jgi:hypothetical protein